MFPFHPNTFHALRGRWGAAEAETDAGDSFNVADYTDLLHASQQHLTAFITSLNR